MFLISNFAPLALHSCKLSAFCIHIRCLTFLSSIASKLQIIFTLFFFFFTKNFRCLLLVGAEFTRVTLTPCFSSSVKKMSWGWSQWSSNRLSRCILAMYGCALPLDPSCLKIQLSLQLTVILFVSLSSSNMGNSAQNYHPDAFIALFPCVFLYRVFVYKRCLIIPPAVRDSIVCGVVTVIQE